VCAVKRYAFHNDYSQGHLNPLTVFNLIISHASEVRHFMENNTSLQNIFYRIQDRKLSAADPSPLQFQHCFNDEKMVQTYSKHRTSGIAINFISRLKKTIGLGARVDMTGIFFVNCGDKKCDREK
jgi:hypothetical protein